jgi:hypothetical protein
MSINKNLTAIRFYDSHDMFQQNGFPMAALADEGHDLPLFHPEADAPEDINPVKRFIDVDSFNHNQNNTDVRK